MSKKIKPAYHPCNNNDNSNNEVCFDASNQYISISSQFTQDMIEFVANFKNIIKGLLLFPVLVRITTLAHLSQMFAPKTYINVGNDQDIAYEQLGLMLWVTIAYPVLVVFKWAINLRNMQSTTFKDFSELYVKTMWLLVALPITVIRAVMLALCMNDWQAFLQDVQEKSSDSIGVEMSPGKLKFDTNYLAMCMFSIYFALTPLKLILNWMFGEIGASDKVTFCLDGLQGVLYGILELPLAIIVFTGFYLCVSSCEEEYMERCTEHYLVSFKFFNAIVHGDIPSLSLKEKACRSVQSPVGKCLVGCATMFTHIKDTLHSAVGMKKEC